MKKVLDAYSSKNDINIKQIIAYKDNLLEIEEYKDGFKKDDTMNVMSVTKSVTSLLIGIAIDQGLIALPFPSPVDHVLSELSSMTHPSWVAPHSMV